MGLILLGSGLFVKHFVPSRRRNEGILPVLNSGTLLHTHMKGWVSFAVFVFKVKTFPILSESIILFFSLKALL